MVFQKLSDEEKSAEVHANTGADFFAVVLRPNLAPFPWGREFLRSAVNVYGNYTVKVMKNGYLTRLVPLTVTDGGEIPEIVMYAGDTLDAGRADLRTTFRGRNERNRWSSPHWQDRVHARGCR